MNARVTTLADLARVWDGWLNDTPHSASARASRLIARQPIEEGLLRDDRDDPPPARAEVLRELQFDSDRADWHDGRDQNDEGAR